MRALEEAIAAAKDGRLDETIEKCDRALSENPKLEHAYLLKGSACAMKGDAACERTTYAAGLEALPVSAALLREMGLSLLSEERYTEAIEHLERAGRAIERPAPEYDADLAYAYVFVNRLEEAEFLARRAFDASQACFPCAMSLGQVLLARKKFGEAVSAYQAASKLAPSDPDAARSLAKAHFLAGDYTASSEIYEALVKADPDDGRLRVQAAQCALKATRYQDAVRHLEVVLGANPDDPKLLELLLEAQTRAKDRRGAEKTRRRLGARGK